MKKFITVGTLAHALVSSNISLNPKAMQMNKLEKNFMKIISYIFIVHMAFTTSDSLCMLTMLTKPSFRSSRTTFSVQRRSFGSIPILSEERYMALWKNTKKADKELQKLKQNPYSNPSSIDILQKQINRNRRILNTCQISISADLSDDVIS